MYNFHNAPRINDNSDPQYYFWPPANTKTLPIFNVYGSLHRKCIPIYIQQDARLHSLFISGNCSTRFGWYLHPSSGAHTTLSTAPGICQTVTATCCYIYFLFSYPYKLPVLSNLYPTICNVTQFIISGNCSTCFGWYHHPSSEAYTTVSTASGICHTAIAAVSSNGLTNTRCCR
jgi:hypothetical protein